MKLTLLLAWRHLAFQPARTLASVLGIAVGIATLIAVLTLDHNTLLTRSDATQRPDPESDLVLQPLLTDKRPFDAVARELHDEPWLRGVTAYATGKFALHVNGRTVAGIELMAVESDASAFHQAYFVARGNDLDYDSDEPQLLITQSLAAAKELSVGDTVALGQQDRRNRITFECKNGELVANQPRARGRSSRPAAPQPFRIVGILAPTQLGFSKQRMLTTFNVGRKLIGDKLRPLFWANFDRSQIDYHGLESRLRDRYLVIEPERAPASEAPEEVAFRSGVRFCGFLALFLGLYIIFNTMSMSLVERVRYIGLLRALGVTRTRLLGIFAVEGGALALLGAGLSLLLAKWIVEGLASRGISTLGLDTRLTIREVPWGQVSVVLAAGVSFCLLGVLYPFLRAARLSVIDALRRGVIELSRDPFTGVRRSILLGMMALMPVAWFVGAPSDSFLAGPLYEAILILIGLVGGTLTLLLIFPRFLQSLAGSIMWPFRGPAVLLARSTIRSSHHRVFGSVSGLMLVFAAVFLIMSVLDSLKSETRQFGRVALADKLYLRVTAEGGEAMAELRRTVPELSGLLNLNAETRSPFIIRGLDPVALSTGSLATGPRASGSTSDQQAPSVMAERGNAQADFRSRRTVLLSTRCADDFGYELGARITLNTASDGAVDFFVRAITDEYGFAPDDRVFGVVSTDNMKRYWCDDGEGAPGWYVVDRGSNDFSDLDGWQGRIENVLGEGTLIELRTGENIAGEYIADLERDFAIFHAILILTVALAGMGILNAMVIAVMQRRREIGLLRSVGLTGGQVAAMLLLEAGTFGLLGGVLGVLLGIPLAIVTTRALTVMSHLEISFRLVPEAALGVIGGAVAIAVFAVLLPVLRANRMRLSNVMRYE